MGGHESQESPSMYKNSKGMSRLEGDQTGLTLPPLDGPSPRMSIVNEGLSSKRNSRIGSIRAGSQNQSIVKRSSQNNGF